MTTSNSLLRAAVCLLATIAVSTAQGQALQFLFRADNGAEGSSPITPAQSTITAAHAQGLSSAFDQWNQLTVMGTDPAFTQINLTGATQGLVDGEGNALGAGPSAPFFVYTELSSFASGITDPSIAADPFTVNFAPGFTSGAQTGAEDTSNPGNDGPGGGNADPNGNELYQGLLFTRPDDLGLGFLIGGLAADTYEVFYYAAESNATDRASDVTFQALAAGDLDADPSAGVNDPLAAGSNLDAFEDGVNFTRFQVDVDAGGSIAIFQQVTSGALFTSVGAIQIIPSSLLNVTGDIDGNGILNTADFNLLRDNFFSTDTSAGNFGPSSALGEAVGALDGVVDLQDFVVFRDAFAAAGGDISGLSLAVPEPSAMLILCASLAGSLGLRRRS